MYTKYKPELDYSYTLGVFPTLELVKNQPDEIIEIFIHSSAENSDGVKQITDICRQKHILFNVNDKQIARLSLKENVHAIAVFNKYDSKLDQQANHLVLVNPSDMGNLGTIMRNMVSFDMFNLAMIIPAADIFNPRAVRASMGAMFMVNFAYFSSFEEYREKFGGHNFYPFMLDGKEELSEVKLQSPYGLVFGNESSGLDASYQDIGTSVFIKQSKNTDSLNLGISTGVALYESYS